MILINNLNYPQNQNTGPNPYYYMLDSVVKLYPIFTKQTKYDKPRRIERKQEYEPNEFFTNTSTPRHKSHFSANHVESSVSRSKTNIRDVILCNQFNQFATFTFNGQKSNRKKYGYTTHNRENVDGLKLVMQNWLKSQQKTHGNFHYLIVPEFHKDGKSIHFHALIKDYPGQLVDSGKKVNNRKAYNISSYRAGHSTLVKIDNSPGNIEKVANYVTKYITKDMPLFGNKKRYWCSKGLVRPDKVRNPFMTDEIANTFKPTYYVEEYGITLRRSELVLKKHLANNLEFM